MAPQGNNLPIFPTFDARPSEERLELVVERLMDRADRALMTGAATQAQYDAWAKSLDAWACAQR